MKKLMIAAAIVCAAAISQAAATSWQLVNKDDIVAPLSGNFSGTMQVYAFAKDAEFVKENAITSWTVTVADGSFDSGAFDSTLFVEETTYSFYLYGETTAGGKDYEYVGAKTNAKALGTGTRTVNLKAGEWAAVPEPTSGLLLLLGVAGLALRRRRA